MKTTVLLRSTALILALTTTGLALAEEPMTRAEATEAYESHPISRFPVPSIDELPEDVQQMVAAIKARRGFVPNVVYALAHRPAELRAFMGLVQAINRPGSNVTEAEREMIVITHSAYNGCSYCIASHGATLRVMTGNPYLSDQLATNYHEADITERQKAMLDFAIKLTAEPAQVGEHDYEVLRGHGLDDEDIWDITSLTAFFNMSNRLMSGLGVRPDAEYYSMGR